MKITLKNSNLVFKVSEIIAGEYPTRDICLSANGYYNTKSGVPVKLESSNWGSSDFIPVNRIQSVVLSCTKERMDLESLNGIMYFTAKDINSYISSQYAETTKAIDIVTTLNPPANAQFCILQSYLQDTISSNVTGLPADAKIVIN